MAGKLILFSGVCCAASTVDLAIKQNFADPCVIQTEQEWYAFSTTARGLHIPIAKSADFTSWSVLDGQDAMPKLPPWVYSDSPAVAAPDVIKLPNGSFVVYFDATPSDNPWRRCVGAATASNVAGPYTPIANALACGGNKYGYIDASGFVDPSTGHRYILFKLDGTNPGPPNAPLSRVPAEIFIQQVSNTDGVTLIGSPTSIFKSFGNDSDYGTVEAPSLVKNPSGDGYVFFYSSGFYKNSTYTVSYATAETITGPYTRRSVLLKTGDDGLNAPGGADITVAGDRMVFHANEGASFNNVRYMYTANITISGDNVVIH